MSTAQVVAAGNVPPLTSSIPKNSSPEGEPSTMIDIVFVAVALPHWVLSAPFS